MFLWFNMICDHSDHKNYSEEAEFTANQIIICKEQKGEYRHSNNYLVWVKLRNVFNWVRWQSQLTEEDHCTVEDMINTWKKTD